MPRMVTACVVPIGTDDLVEATEAPWSNTMGTRGVGDGCTEGSRVVRIHW